MKRLFTIISYLAGISFILALVLFLSEREHLKERTVNYLSRQIEKHTGWEIDFQKVELTLPLTLKVEGIVIAKEDETILTAKNLFFSINPWELITHRIVFDNASIEELIVCGKIHSKASESVALDGLFTPEDNTVLFGLKINELLIKKFSITPELLHFYHLNEIAFLKESTSLRLNINVNPFDHQVFAEIALTQQERPEIVSILSIKKELDDWLTQLRIHIPAKSILSDKIPFNSDLNYSLISQFHLNSSFELQKGDIQITYQNEDDKNDHILGNYGSFQTTLLMQDNKTFKFSNLQGLIGPLIFEGEGQYLLDKDFIDLQLSCISCDDSLLRRFVDGSLKKGKIDLKISGSLAHPNGEIHLAADECIYKTDHVENFDAKCLFKYLDSKLSSEIEIHGIYKEVPVIAMVLLTIKEGEKIDIQNLLFNYGSNHISGNLLYQLDNSLVEGNLAGELNASLASSFTDLQVEGPVVFNSNLYSSDHQPKIQLADLLIQSSLLQIDECFLERFVLNIKGIDLIGKSLGTLTANCQKVRFHKWEAADLMFSTHADPTLDNWPFSLICHDTVDAKTELFSKGSWRYDPGTFKLVLDAFEGKIAQYPYALQDRTVIEFQADKFILSPLYLKIKNGTFFATCESSENELRSVIKAQEFPLGLIYVFDPTFLVDGLLSLDLELSDNSEGVKGDVKALLKGLHMKDEKFSVSNPVNLNLNAHFQDKLLKCSGSMLGLGPHPFDLQAEIPLDLGLRPLKVEILKDQNFNLHAAVEGKIESFLELFMPANSTTITGNLSLALNASGTLNDPNLVGHGNLSNMTYEVSDLGLVVNQGHLNIDISKTLLTISNLRAVSSNGGFVTGSGHAELNSEKSFPFDMTFQLGKIPLAPQEYVATTISGNLAFKGNAEKALLEGKVTTDTLKIEIPEHIPQLVHSVAVTYINQPRHLIAPTTYKPHASDWPLFLNVEMDIPSQGYVTGKDWESEWKGNVVFSGTSDAPLVHGGCSIKRGEYNFNGKAFQINQGTINFAGDLEKKTSVYVIAHRDLDTIRAEVIVKGLIKNPAITFRSNPPLPQREILSWILFNRGTSDINSFQGSQLNESITNLSTKGSSEPDMLSQFREKIGVDRLDISRESGASNEVSVQVGKYISRGILVSVNRSITAETNRIAIEAAVMKHVKVQAEIGDDSDAQLMLKWKKDY